MKVRDIIIVIVALLLAILLAFATKMLLRPESEAAKEMMAAKQEDLQEILVANMEYKIGDVVSESNFHWVKVPKKSLTNKYVTKNLLGKEIKLEKVVLRSPLAKDEPLKRNDFVSGGQKGVLSALVSPGMRAVTVPIDRNAPINTWIAPGDYVDVMVAKRNSGRGRDAVGKVVVGKVKILSIDNNLASNEPPKGDSKDTKNITLEVSVAQAVLLAEALQDGKVMIGLYSIFKSSNDGQLVIDNHNDGSQETVTVIRGGKPQGVNS